MGEQHMPGRKGDERRREAWGALRHYDLLRAARELVSVIYRHP